jgi:tRNA1(Val) A37 N6-methylase TrmN6
MNTTHKTAAAIVSVVGLVVFLLHVFHLIHLFEMKDELKFDDKKSVIVLTDSTGKKDTMLLQDFIRKQKKQSSTQ